MLIKGKVSVGVSMLFTFSIIMSSRGEVSMKITSLANNINCFLSLLVDFLLTSAAIRHKSTNLDGTCELCRAFCPNAACCIALPGQSATQTQVPC